MKHVPQGVKGFFPGRTRRGVPAEEKEGERVTLRKLLMAESWFSALIQAYVVR
jgi:hypothetical protein